MTKDGASATETRLHEFAYERLCEALMRGDFAPGQQLSLRALAERLGVSVTPVREAVSRLTALGALKAHPKRYIEVSRLSAEAYLDMLALRRLLEGHAAVRAAERISESEIRQIAEINEVLMRYAHKGELNKAMKENQRFHFAVYRASQSKYLVENIERLWVLIGPSLNLHLAEEYARDREVLRSGFENHDLLIDALTKRDPAAALRAITEDMGVSCGHMLSGLLRQSDLSIDALMALNALAQNGHPRGKPDPSE